MHTHTHTLIIDVKMRKVSTKFDIYGVFNMSIQIKYGKSGEEEEEEHASVSYAIQQIKEEKKTYKSLFVYLVQTENIFIEPIQKTDFCHNFN